MWRMFRGSSGRAHSHSGSSSNSAWQAPHADVELATIGPGIRTLEPSVAHGPLSPSSAYPSHTFNLDAAERPSSSLSGGTIFVGFLFLMLVVTLLPSSFFLFFCVGLLIAVCLRALLQMRHRRPRPPSSAAVASPRVARVSRIPDNSAWVIFHRDQPVSLDALNAQLSMISRDFNNTAFSPRSEQPPRHDPAADTLSDSDISSFPVHQYRRAVRHHRAAAVQQQQGGSSLEAARSGAGAEPADGGRGAGAGPKFRKDGSASTSGEHAPAPGVTELQPRRSVSAASGRGAAAAVLSPKPGASPAVLGGEGDGCAASAAAGEPGPWTCVVCLDSYQEGEVIMTLPCMHHFHQACLVPWLKHQGKRTSCPMCKTPCFS